MIQIVIWGIACMLVVKGFDVLHQQSIASKAGHGALAPALIAAVIAFGGAVLLIVLADQQVKSTPTMPAMPNFGNP